MDAVGGLVSDAHVGALAVVKADEASDVLAGLVNRGEAPCLTIDALALDDAVHPLRYGVVGGLVVLGHRYPDAVRLQLLNVHVAAILHTPVGVVDKPREVAAASLVDGHPKRPEHEDGPREPARHQPTIFLE